MTKIAREPRCWVGLIAGLAILFVFVRTTPAPPTQKPEKIKAGPINYDRAQQAFIVPTSMRFGIATAGEAAGFALRTTVEIADPDFTRVTGLGPQVDPVEWREGGEPGRDRFVALVPQVIPWDRNGGTFAGDAIVTTTIQVINLVRRGDEGPTVEIELVALSLMSVQPVDL